MDGGVSLWYQLGGISIFWGAESSCLGFLNPVFTGLAVWFQEQFKDGQSFLPIPCSSQKPGKCKPSGFKGTEVIRGSTCSFFLCLYNVHVQCSVWCSGGLSQPTSLKYRLQGGILIKEKKGWKDHLELDLPRTNNTSSVSSPQIYVLKSLSHLDSSA